MTSSRARSTVEPLLDPQVLEEAAEWMLRLGESPVSEHNRLAWKQWREGAPEHALAWEKAERLQGLLAAIPPSLAHPVLGRKVGISRRATIKLLGSWLVLMPAGWLTWRLWEQAGWDASWTTAVGQRREIRLGDGSVVELDTDTTLDVALGARARLLRLRKGQLRVTTAKDPQSPPRPLSVVTEHGRMQALGTVFDVRVEPAHSRLAVLSGAVRVEPAAARDSWRRIEAGQQTTFDARRIDSPGPIGLDASAWPAGMLAADAMPLRQLLAELGRYHRGVLTCSDDVAGLSVSGAFPLDDLDASLGMLVATYPLTVQRRAAGWWTTVGPRR